MHHDFGDVSSCGSKGGPGASGRELGRKRGAGRWRTVVAKRAGRSGQHRPYNYRRPKAQRTKQVVDTGPDFGSRNCTFT